MSVARLELNLLALAALPHVAVDVNPVGLYEKFLTTEYPDPPTEDRVGWVTEQLAELAVAVGAEAPTAG